MLEPGYAVTPNIRLVRQLGEGGMGSVWIAEHTTLRTEVAVKFVQAELATETALKRFSREASLAAQIKSPHVVQTYDHGTTDAGVPYIVMELLEGESLAERLARGPLAPREVAMVIAQVSKVLERAHGLGIIHRDLKPANLFLVESGYEVFVKVLDFGIAKQTGEQRGEITSELTGAKAAIGTPYYMSPEALRGSAEIDHRTDLWSLAVVAYHALTGRLPFEGETFGDQLMLTIEQRFDPPSRLCGVSSLVDDWFRRAFLREPSDRFADAVDFAKSFAATIDAASDRGHASARSSDVLSTSSEPRSVSQEELAPTQEVAVDEAGRPRQGATAEGATNPGTFEGATSEARAAAGATSRWPLVAAVVLVAGGAAAFALSRSDADRPTTAEAAPGPTPAPPPAPPAAEPAQAPPSATVPPSPATVSLTIDSVPPRVEVLRGDEVLGHAPGPIALPASSGSVELTFRAPGHLPSTVAVDATEGRTVEVRLRPVPIAPPAKKKGLEW